MQNLRSHTTTLLDPDIQSQLALYRFSERLCGGLPHPDGNILLLLKSGVPTPSAAIALPRALQGKLRVNLYLNARPSKHFIRHERPVVDADEIAGDSEGGPMRRLRISRLPLPQKHAIIEQVNL